MVIKDKKLVFIHIPKCGGISVKHSINKDYNYGLIYKERTHPFIISNPVSTPRSQYEKNYEIPYHFTYDEAWTQFPNFRYVTQVRHPLDRWASLYKHFCDSSFIKTWSIETWTENAMENLKDACYYGIFENIKLFERAGVFWDMTKMLLPAWMYYRQPEVEIHKLEENTIWKALNIAPLHKHKSSKILVDYDREKVKDLIYDYYKKDFEYYGG